MAAPSPAQQQHPKVPAAMLAASSSPSSSKSQRTTSSSSPPRQLPPPPAASTPSSSSPATTAATSALATALQNAAAASLWISLSASVILFNKHILAFSGFPFPITLTAFHMAFSWACAAALVHCTSLVELPSSTKVVVSADCSSSTTTTTQKGLGARTYLRRIAPVGALFAGTLWLGNAAYMHLSVSFIQMLKALMPAAVYGVGCALGTETFARSRALNMAVVTAGVAAASAGEVQLSLLGVALQLGSVATESTRLALVQILLQQKKVKKASPSSSSSKSSDSSKIALNPVTTMYYLAPVSLLCLSLPWLAFERSRLVATWGAGGGGGVGGEGSPPPPTSPFYLLDSSHAIYASWWRLAVSPLTLLANAALAFALNLSVFLLIGRTSALAMNVAGVVKDWLLIGLSALLFRAPVTALNLAGYSVAFAGVCWYNKAKFDEMKASAAAAAAAAAVVYSSSATAATEEGPEREVELKPLLPSSSSDAAANAAVALGADRKIKAGRAV